MALAFFRKRAPSDCYVLLTSGSIDLSFVGSNASISRPDANLAKGVIFITSEDETSITNLIVWPKMSEKYGRSGLLPVLWTPG